MDYGAGVDISQEDIIGRKEVHNHVDTSVEYAKTNAEIHSSFPHGTQESGIHDNKRCRCQVVAGRGPLTPL